MVTFSDPLSARRVEARDGNSALVRRAEAGPEVRVLFVHPANLQGSVWLPVIDRLPAELACAAIDLLGHGESVRRARYSVEAWSASCLGLVDYLGWRSFHVVGGSVGAPIVARHAVDHPGRIDSLTTVGGACLPARAEDTQSFLVSLAEYGTRPLLESMVADEYAAYGANGSTETVEISDNSVAQVTAIWRAATEAHAMQYASRLHSPVLAIVGERDQGCPPEDSRAFAAATHGRLEVLEDQGHLPMTTDPVRVASLIHRHVTTHAPQYRLKGLR